jgi:hypothetical protein
MHIDHGQWLPLTALVLGAAVRLLKSDTKLPIDVPSEHRMKLAWAIGLVIGVVDLVAGGEPVGAAILAIGSPLIAHFGHELFIEALRGGREIPVPGLMKPDDKQRPRISLPPIAIVFAVLLSGCAGTFEEAKLAGAQDRKLGAAPGSAERCSDLDDAAALWSSVSKGSAVVAGGAAMAPLHEEVRDDKTGRIVAASVAGGAAAFAAFSAHMSGAKGESWARECSGQ